MKIKYWQKTSSFGFHFSREIVALQRIDSLLSDYVDKIPAYIKTRGDLMDEIYVQFQDILNRLFSQEEKMTICYIYKRPLLEQAKYPLTVCLKELKYGRPINTQEFLDDLIEAARRFEEDFRTTFKE